MNPVTAVTAADRPAQVLFGPLGEVGEGLPAQGAAAAGHQVTGDGLDDGPVKPVRIWGRTGRRPILAVGNSNGDIEMLQYTQAGTPSLCVLVRHDDAEREFDYAAGAERALDEAQANGWTVVSIRNDWAAVFGPAE